TARPRPGRCPTGAAPGDPHRRRSGRARRPALRADRRRRVRKRASLRSERAQDLVTVVEAVGAAVLTPGIAAPDAIPALREARGEAPRRRGDRVPRPIRRLVGPVLLVAVWQA